MANPFSGLDPDRGGVPGLLGTILGRPSGRELRGKAQGMALQGLAGRIQKGMPPNRALMEFLSSQEGMDYFVNDPDGLKGLSEFIAGQSPQGYAPGTQFQGPDGDVTGRVPTTEEQQFEGFAEMAGTSPEQKAALAHEALRNFVTSQGGSSSSTENERAMERLMGLGLIAPDEADKFLAGLIIFKPMENATGDTIGYMKIDSLSGKSQTYNAREGGGFAPGPGGGIQNTPTMPDGMAPVGPPAGQPEMPVETIGTQGEVEPQTGDLNLVPMSGYFGTLKGHEPDPEIVRGAGFDAWFAKAAGGVWGQMFRSFTGKTEASRRAALAFAKQQAQTLRETGRLAADQTALDAIIDTLGLATSDIQAAQIMLDFRNAMEKRAQSEYQLAGKPGASDSMRKTAGENFDAIARALGAIPPRQALERIIETLESEEGPVVRRMKQLGGIKSGIEEDIGNALGADPEVPSFASQAELEAALKAGKVEDGDDVIVDGVHGKVYE